MIGSVIKVRPIDAGQDEFYVVLPDGVQRISQVTAAIIRNADPRNPPPPIELAPNALLSIPQSRALNVDFYPDRTLKLVDPVSAPVTCLSWTQSRDEAKPRTQVLSGRSLPLAETVHPVAVVTADPNKGTANNVYVPPGTGQLVQIAGNAGGGHRGIDVVHRGHRCAIRVGDESARPQGDRQVALGITARPLPAPWSIVSLLPAGPALSKADALISHDSLPLDPHPGVISTNSPVAGAPGGGR